MRLARLIPLILIVVALALASCQRNRPSDRVVYVERPAETIYNEAHRQIDMRRYDQAASLFGEVERQHPYSEWARRSILMAAYSHYMSNRYEQAISGAQRFISLHPGNRQAVYAYYLIAICHFEQIMDVGRDQGTTQAALAALEQVVRRYPDSRYAQDARLKIDMTRDHLAGKEMDVGRWYLRRGFHVAAINRFRTVIDEYQTTSHTPEALHRIVEAYVGLGVNEEARQVAAVLGHNFPGSVWYQDSYRLLTREGLTLPGEGAEQGPPSFLRRALDRIFS